MALKGSPFEPLEFSSLRVLSLKTALLLALASVKRVGDLQALSINSACLEFGPNDSKVVLKPRLGYVPKVLSTPFRAQVITLPASVPPPPPMGSQESLLCPVRAREYTLSVLPCTEIQNCFLLASVTVLKVALLRSRGIASSWAWSSRLSISDICEAAGWSSPSTFARFYNLDSPALQARVLSA